MREDRIHDDIANRDGGNTQCVYAIGEGIR